MKREIMSPQLHLHLESCMSKYRAPKNRQIQGPPRERVGGRIIPDQVEKENRKLAYGPYKKDNQNHAGNEETRRKEQFLPNSEQVGPTPRKETGRERDRRQYLSSRNKI